MDKVRETAADAVREISDGASLAVGGFGLSGVPDALIVLTGELLVLPHVRTGDTCDPSGREQDAQAPAVHSAVVGHDA
ncbi:hypothetical protein H0H10_36650 [Streptomyces sp. TRM S81-3]|uniref:Uncharacterized protein n=1 Tax=Streptomyces griseicoloratus TaxID=2752516 RepID=A0A926L8K4_9ACTN|nr:hypothetical protein [Streptomyces griseicoloratus]